MAYNKSSSAKKSSRNSKKTDKSGMRLRPIWMIIFIVILVVAVVFLVRACSVDKESDTSHASVNIIDMNANVQSIEETHAAEETRVKIDLQSCRIVVGEKVYVTATVTPADTYKSLQWKSSDEKVFKVSNDGLVEVVGIGTAALTATVGDISDAIVIEGVESESAKSQMDLPWYKEALADSEKSTQKATENATGKEKETETATGVQETKSSAIPKPTVPATNPVPTETKQPTTQTSAFPTIPPTEKIESKGLRSSQLPEVLGNYGYSAAGDNVYVYGDGDSYAGEIIIQPNVAIIYIKKNTAEYNSAIQSVLEELLPDEYRQAWNNYVSATTDRTFTLEGRRVRIVTAGNGGHSQIVVYN